MRKFALLFLLVFAVLGEIAYGDYKPAKLPNPTVYTSSQQIKLTAGRVYRVEFVATANGGAFTLYNGLSGVTEANVKSEGSEATANNSKIFDYSNMPLEFTTAIYLHISGGSVVISYE